MGIDALRTIKGDQNFKEFQANLHRCKVKVCIACSEMILWEQLIDIAGAFIYLYVQADVLNVRF